MSIDTLEELQHTVTPRPEVVASLGSVMLDGSLLDLTAESYNQDVTAEHITFYEEYVQRLAMGAGYGALVQSELTAVSGLSFNTPPINERDALLRENIHSSFRRLHDGESVVQTDLILEGFIRIAKNIDLPPKDHVKAAEFFIRAVRYCKQTDNSKKCDALLQVLDKLPQLVR